LVVPVVDGIAVHAHRLTPAPAVIARGSHEDIHVSVGVIAPRDVKVAPLRVATGIDADLGEAVRAGNSSDAEVSWPVVNDAAIMFESLAAIVGDGHHDAVTVVPDGVKSSVGSDHSVEAFESAVVVAGQSGCAIEPDRWRPALATIGGARKQKLAGGEREL